MKRKLKIAKKLPINGLMFSFFIVIGILAYAKPGRFINELFILISIILLFDGFYFFLMIPHLKVKIYVPERVEKNESFPLKIYITNKAYMPSPYIYIRVKEGKRVILENDQEMGLMLGIRKDAEQEVYCNARLCGKEEVVLEEVRLQSFIGFFRKHVTLNLSATVQVLPEIRHLEYMQHFNAFLTQLNTSEGKQSEQEDRENTGDEVGYELRQYREGDSQRLIHWKIAAFKGEYLVRQREGSKEKKRELFFILSPFVCLESNEEEAILQDKMITTFVSLVAHYLNEGQKVRVAYYKDKEWQYIKIRDARYIHILQEGLSDYMGLEVLETPNQRSIIRELFKLTNKRSGIKILISSYWEKDMEEYILKNKFQTEPVPIIWTGSRSLANLPQALQFPFWHMTDEYGLVLCQEKKLENSKDKGET